MTSIHYRNGVKIGNCEVLPITHARDHTIAILAIPVVLWVTLSSSLFWNTQTQKVVNKANKIVGFLERNVGPGNKEVFTRLHNALVIPILQYAVPLQLLFLQKNIERVQLRVT